MSSQAEELVRSIHSIATLPSVYERLRAIIADPSSSARDVGAVVADDPGLTARLLKIVNSAFFGFTGRIDTVSRAIAILGMQQLTDLTLATSVISSFQGMPQDLVSFDSFWRHSLGVGVCSRVIATHRGEDKTERFFVAGLLHDLGLLILYMKLPGEMRRILNRSAESGEALAECERFVLGFDHAEVGWALLKQWRLPESLQEAVRYHHNPEGAKLFPVEAATVHVADIITNGLGLGTSGESVMPPLSASAWALLSLEPEALQALGGEIQKQYEDVIKIMLG